MARSPARLLLDWYALAKRDLPWRRTRDPYRILLSEVMLQQTRVAAALPYYERFLARFPDFQTLAAAPESDVLALWSGLGYYARARNLQATARQVVALGEFPRTLEEIRQLPGIGDYTAAAVASICFGLPHVVVDGNVLRVMSRLRAEKGDIGATATRARIRAEAQALLDARHSGEFNQALMELGATVCLPSNPHCLLCPWSGICEARRLGLQGELPIKTPKTVISRIELHVLVIVRQGRVLVRQRSHTETVMPGFWELPHASDLPEARVGASYGKFSHSITHREYVIRVSEAVLDKPFRQMKWKPLAALRHLPMSTIARKALAKAGIAPDRYE